jgi:myo-inositol-1(or 4)-monophosphatase
LVNSEQLPWSDEKQAALVKGIREVGSFQLENFGKLNPERLEVKSNVTDLVSWVDTESEARLSRLLTELLPSAGQMGEEGLCREGDGRMVWIVDPLDGTLNYAYGFPFFCISVGLLLGDEPVVGVIHAPRLAETFHAWAGHGAFAGESPISVSGRKDPLRCLHATGFADRRGGSPDVNLRNFSHILKESCGIRRAGSAALDLAYVAAGTLDGFWEMNLNPWDVTAGICLVREAGGGGQ